MSHPADGGDAGILPMHGRPVTSLWLEGAPAYGGEDFAFHTYIEPRLGGGYVRRGDWKLAWWKQDGEFVPGALFNIAEDPGEVHDVSATHPDITAELARAWRDYARGNGVDAEAAGAAGGAP